MNAIIIGCGNIADLHAKAIKSSGNSILAVVDNDYKRACNFANKYNTRAFKELDFNLKTDVVHICTPPIFHYELIKNALLNNINVISEKPLSLNPTECLELYNLAKNNNLINAVNFNNRYYDTIDSLKNSINNQQNIKQIFASYFQEFHCLPENYSWRYNSKISGNLRAVSEIASHVIDLLRYICKMDFLSVSANFIYSNKNRYLKNGIMYAEYQEDSEIIEIPTEDSAMIILKLSNGALVSLNVSEISHGKTNELKLHIDMQNKSLYWNNLEPYNLITAEKLNGSTTLQMPFGGGFSTSFNSFIEDVYNKLADRSHKSIFANFYDGYCNALICDAIFKSANNNGKWENITYAR